MIQGNMYLVRTFDRQGVFVAVFLNKIHSTLLFTPTGFRYGELFEPAECVEQHNVQWAHDLGPMTPTTTEVDAMNAIKRLRID